MCFRNEVGVLPGGRIDEFRCGGQNGLEQPANDFEISGIQHCHPGRHLGLMIESGDCDRGSA